jgi:hypothetical protein
MDGYMAAGTFPAGLESELSVRRLGQLMEACMALQTELPAFPTNQQHSIGRAMRVMAADAAFHLGSRVLMNEGATFLNMATHAGFRLRFHQAGRIRGAVRAVAIRALHQSFRDAVVYGLRELRADRGVAGVAKLRLGRLEQRTLQPAGLLLTLRHLEKLIERRLRLTFTGNSGGPREMT